MREFPREFGFRAHPRGFATEPRSGSEAMAPAAKIRSKRHKKHPQRRAALPLQSIHPPKPTAHDTALRPAL